MNPLLNQSANAFVKPSLGEYNMLEQSGLHLQHLFMIGQQSHPIHLG